VVPGGPRGFESLSRRHLTVDSEIIMHEWALAEAVIRSVTKFAKNEGFMTVDEVTIRVGELQNVDIEIFEFALSQLRLSMLDHTVFRVEIQPTKLRCRVCNRQWTPHSSTLEEEIAESVHFVPEVAHSYLKCPQCGSPDFEVLTGRGVWLQSIRGEKA
jgi:hydrogenase nickel incorporation protein HypA/HybF